MPAPASLFAPARRLLVASSSPAAMRPWLLGLVLLLLSVGAWCWAQAWRAEQERLLWQRLSPQAVERFVVDLAVPPRAQVWPALPGPAALSAVCAEPPAAWVHQRRGWQRQALAHCLAQVTADGPRLQALAQQFAQQLQAQHEAAARGLHLLNLHEQAARQQLLAALRQAQGGRQGAPVPPRQDLGAATVAAQRAALERALQRHTEALAQAQTLPLAERVRTLGLRAHGLRWLPAGAQGEAQLQPDRRSLAEELEWLRRGQQALNGHEPLSELRELGLSVGLGGGLLLAVVALCSRGGWARRSAVSLAWLTVLVLVMIGALVLTDLSLTGEPGLRLLVLRQGLELFGGTPAMAWLHSPGGGLLPFHVPLVALALLQAVMALAPVVHAVQGWADAVLACVRQPLDRGGAAGTVALALVPALLGGGAMLVVGGSAALSEGLLALGLVGLAFYAANQASLANVQEGVSTRPAVLALSALGVAALGAALRGDLGHLLITLLLGAGFSLLFAWRWLRVLVSLVLALGLAWVVASLHAERPLPPVAGWIQHLSSHAAERFVAWFSPFEAGSSDLARVRWLVAAGGDSGWGLGYVPWSGLAPSGAHQGLPLQGPADYVLAVLAAVWGGKAAVGLLLLHAGLFLGAAGLGLSAAFAPGLRPAQRLMPALGALGCLVVALKGLLSASGVSGLLPLTGIPVAVLGYAPSAQMAALAYLLAALWPVVAKPQSPSRGIYLKGRAPTLAPGRLSRRYTVMAVLALSGLCLWGVAAWRWADAGLDELPATHRAAQRAQLAQMLVAASGVPAAPAGEAAPACPALSDSLARWNEALASLPRPKDGTARQLSVAALREAGMEVDVGGPRCDAAAKHLNDLLRQDRQRVLQPLREGYVPTVRDADFRTPNAWRAVPGCLRNAVGETLLGVCDGQPLADATLLGGAWQGDAWLQRNLAPLLQLGLREPASRTRWNQHEVAQGADLQVQLDPRLQALAMKLAACFTGQLKGDACQAVLPRDPAWAQRYYQGGLRAGAFGLVLADADTGRVLALANAMSDCTRSNLQQGAQRDADGRLPALRANELCAALPDQRSQRLPEHAPVHWMLPLGSSFKPWVVLSGLQAGLVHPADLDRWLQVLAKSEDQAAIQRLALEGSAQLLETLRQAGYGQPLRDAAWGQARERGTAHLPGWRVPAFEGLEQLQTTQIGYDRYRQIEADKRAGINVDRRYGEPAVRQYLAARRLADASIGGGELRGSIFGLTQAWVDLVRQAQGQALGARLHLASAPGLARQAPPVAPPQGKPSTTAQRHAQWVLEASRGVTASRAQGTAQGSCRVVFGRCPETGLPGVVGKTGTADFLTDPEGGRYAKPGLQLPAKVFGGSFTAPDGRRYVVTAMALRVRQPGTATLELHSSAPAEAALTMMREMGVVP